MNHMLIERCMGRALLEQLTTKVSIENHPNVVHCFACSIKRKELNNESEIASLGVSSIFNGVFRNANVEKKKRKVKDFSCLLCGLYSHCINW